MGIRIHKAIGYGTNYPGFDHPGMYNVHWVDFIDAHEEQIINFWEKNNPKQMVKRETIRNFDIPVIKNELERKNKIIDLYQLILYLGKDNENEDDIKDTILLLPLTCYELWQRYDDTIDYYEETVRNKQQPNIIDLTPQCGIFPYITSMIRFREPKHDFFKTEEEKEKFALLRSGRYNQFVGRWSDKQPPLAKGKFLEHLLSDYRPEVPFEIFVLVYYLRDRIGDIDTFINQLRPMIYSYWS